VVLSVPPEILEPRRRQLRVAHGVRDVAVAQPILQRPRIVAGVCERVAAGVAEHVGVDREGHLGARADSLDQPVHVCRREGAAALGREHERRVRELAAELPQRPNLVAAKRVHRRLAVLQPPNVKRRRAGEAALRPRSAAQGLARAACGPSLALAENRIGGSQ
jgi:hypothetical protein